jgi:hypothetical protein
MLQSRAGITNVDYEAQKRVRATLDGENLTPEEARTLAAERIREELIAAGVAVD